MITDKILVVGITGRSGSGKSMVSSHYASLGYPVADGDQLSRQTTQPGSPCLTELAAAFGSDILDENGYLLRRKLAQKAFASPQATQKLVDITHPVIVAELKKQIDAARVEGFTLFFIDGAVIVGGPAEKICDKIIVVTADMRLSISRIILRDSISKAAAYQRLDAQKQEHELCVAADFIIENNGSVEALLHQADDVLQLILQELQQ